MPIFEVTKEDWQDYQNGKDVMLNEVKEEYNYDVGDIAVIRYGQKEMRRKIDFITIDSVENIFKSFDFKRIFPREINKIRALKKAQSLFKKDTVIAFKLNNEIESAPHKPSFNHLAWKILQINPNKIKGVSPFNVRKTGQHTRIKELVKSFKSIGVNTDPILLDENMEVIAGARRYQAALDAGLDTVLCLQKKMDQKEKKIRSFMENQNREPILPKDKFNFIMDLIENEGMSEEDIAKTAGVTKSTIDSWKKYNALPDSRQNNPESIDRYKGISKNKARIMHTTLDEAFQEKVLEEKTKPKRKVTLEFDDSFHQKLLIIINKIDPGKKLADVLYKIIQDWETKKSRSLEL